MRDTLGRLDKVISLTWVNWQDEKGALFVMVVLCWAKSNPSSPLTKQKGNSWVVFIMKTIAIMIIIFVGLHDILGLGVWASVETHELSVPCVGWAFGLLLANLMLLVMMRVELYLELCDLQYFMVWHISQLLGAFLTSFCKKQKSLISFLEEMDHHNSFLRGSF